MKYLSQLVSTASGSAGGLVASRNRFGAYFRRRSTPVNPDTERQQDARNRLATLVNHWVNTLDEEARTFWNNYAAAVATTDLIGQQIFLTGQQWFLGSNSLRLQAGLTVSAAASTIFDRGNFTLPDVEITATGGTTTITISNPATTDTWREDGASGSLLVYVGRPQNATRSFYKGPWRFETRLAGNATFPAEVEETEYVGQVGNHQWIALRALTADARFSERVVLGPYLIEAAP